VDDAVRGEAITGWGSLAGAGVGLGEGGGAGKGMTLAMRGAGTAASGLEAGGSAKGW
jgi:hypothetical protein